MEIQFQDAQKELDLNRGAAKILSKLYDEGKGVFDAHGNFTLFETSTDAMRFNI